MKHQSGYKWESGGSYRGWKLYLVITDGTVMVLDVRQKGLSAIALSGESLRGPTGRNEGYQVRCGQAPMNYSWLSLLDLLAASNTVNHGIRGLEIGSNVAVTLLLFPTYP